MKKITRIWHCTMMLMATLLSAISMQAEANGFTFNSATDKVRVDRDKDAGYMSFAITPWKCVLMRENGEHVMTVYYDRKGTPKAKGNFFQNGEYGFEVYALEGKSSYAVYQTRAKHNEDGKLVKSVMKESYSRAAFKFTFMQKTLPEYLHHNTTSHVDNHGNWVFAGDAWKPGLVRKMYYYNDGYNEQEDAALNKIIEDTLKQHKTDSAMSYVTGIPVFVVALIIKLGFLLLIIYLILLLFKREWAYRPFNRYAGRRVTPYGLFCKAQLHGFIPVALLFLPTLILFGTLTKQVESNGVVAWAWVLLFSLALSVGYCWLFVKRKKAEIGRKTATAIIAFAVWSVLALVALIAIAVVAIWIFIVLAFLFTALRYVIGGFISGASGAGASVIGSMGGGSNNTSNENSDYEPMLDPYNGDDGGVLEGTSRVPLRDNGDGTMTDNKGRLYSRDGDHVRRL